MVIIFARSEGFRRTCFRKDCADIRNELAVKRISAADAYGKGAAELQGNITAHEKGRKPKSPIVSWDMVQDEETG